MKRTTFFYLVSSILVSLLAACGGENSSKLSTEFLLKNKFLGDQITLEFENETNYKIVGSSSGCSWSNEGTYVIEGDKILLHPTKCENSCDPEADPCKSSVGEAICTITEISEKKRLHVQASYEGYSGDYKIVDKLNPCAEIKEEQANIGDGPTEIDGKWKGLADESIIKYEDGRWVVLDATGQEIGPEGQYKISNIEMIDECMNDINIKSLKKGNYLNTSYEEMGTSSDEYSLEGDILTIGDNKSKRLE